MAFADVGATFVTDGVAAGDILYLSGEGEYVVDTVSDETNLVLTATLTGSPSGLSWRLTHSRLCEGSELSNIFRDAKTGRFTVIYESDDFTVSA